MFGEGLAKVARITRQDTALVPDNRERFAQRLAFVRDTGTKRTYRDVSYLAACGAKRTSASDQLSIAILCVHALSNSMILVPLFEPEVRDRICRTVCANFGFGAPGVTSSPALTSRRSSWAATSLPHVGIRLVVIDNRGAFALDHARGKSNAAHAPPVRETRAH
jgi:hypothetical protein